MREIKHFGQGTNTNEVYFITSDASYPEINFRLSALYTFPFERLDRAMKAAGSFRRG